ncbi:MULTISPECIES: heme ABC transporter permease [Idiomarinaceae]|uniref:Heme exporter protein C n=3 Tax=Pseudidiomarina TaxID=2800384 RepID=A0A368V7U6_9GAMM|nr:MULTISPECIES: heme ABC transporter permease [Idiomarinaceae]MDX1525824.1 heme ABC transporter permease [Pseudidiomarina maritima]MRJ41238.1 heme ABC transporter permease [Idiomarina sp. FeN1]NCU56403.1 heme ABC transporter permease [Idiomarina sp. FenA--70]NCU59422.1 heme ABC transporter permease [Idiomarina sp. FenBw--71]PWW16196.1 heme exporter protein C [Pseudidiomarina maritima]
MWKWLHPYAKGEATYRLLGAWLPWLAGSALVTLTVGLVWGMLFAPSDYQQGDSYRIIFIHVPSAMFSMGAYTAMAITALIALVWQIRTAEWAIAAIAPVGAVLTFIALFTGAVWGKPMWGTWWEWDARLTSQLILLFLYIGVLALYYAFTDARTGAKAASVLALVGVVNVPIIHFSVYWWNSLHQGATITKFEKPSMAPEMLIPLLISILGFALLTGALVCQRLRNEILKQEIHRPWVHAQLGVAEQER